MSEQLTSKQLESKQLETELESIEEKVPHQEAKEMEVSTIPRETTTEDTKVVTCSIENMGKISNDYPQGVLIVFTQKDCRYCPPFMDEVLKAVNGKVAIAESGLEDEECMSLAKKLNVEGTPTALFYKNGEEKGRLNPLGKTWDQIRIELEQMVKTQ